MRLSWTFVSDSQVIIAQGERLTLVNSAPVAWQRRFLLIDVGIETRNDVANKDCCSTAIAAASERAERVAIETIEITAPVERSTRVHLVRR